MNYLTEPPLNVEAVHRALNLAAANKVKFPKLRLGDYVFTLSQSRGPNHGAVYIKLGHNDEYLGKLVGHRLWIGNQHSAHRQPILEALQDPAAAARAYGQRTGNCSCCGRDLSKEKSLVKWVGARCAKKYGL